MKEVIPVDPGDVPMHNRHDGERVAALQLVWNAAIPCRPHERHAAWDQAVRCDTEGN